MVFVSMCDKNRSNLVDPLHQVRHIGDNQVNPEHTLFGELNSTINDDDIVFIL